MGAAKLFVTVLCVKDRRPALKEAALRHLNVNELRALTGSEIPIKPGIFNAKDAALGIK